MIKGAVGWEATNIKNKNNAQRLQIVEKKYDIFLL